MLWYLAFRVEEVITLIFEVNSFLISNFAHLEYCSYYFNHTSRLEVSIRVVIINSWDLMPSVHSHISQFINPFKHLRTIYTHSKMTFFFLLPSSILGHSSQINVLFLVNILYVELIRLFSFGFSLLSTVLKLPSNTS